MVGPERSVRKAPRLEWIDNLRTTAILMVVLYHVGGVYESAGLWGWFWIVDDPSTFIWAGIIGIVFDIMAMPIIFFVSGYLVPISLNVRGRKEFLLRKFKRLMIPWAISVVTLIPLYKVIFFYSRGLQQEHWSTYFHIANPNSQNWLWFLPVLFLFNLGYLLLDRAGIRMGNITLKKAVPLFLVSGIVSSYLIGGMLGFRSWTLTPLIDFENERILLYFMCFLLGVICFRLDVFSGKPRGGKLYNTVSATAWLPLTFHMFTRLRPFISPEGFALTPLYRLAWWTSFYLALAGLLYLMVESFRRYLDRDGLIWSELNSNSYGVYIIHVIVLGVFGTYLLRIDIPAVAKYPLLFFSTFLVSNLLVSIYRSVFRADGAEKRQEG